MKHPTIESFKKDVANHAMSVELDDGVHRCLHFGKPGSPHLHFRIITWPGGLTLTGDMETFTFSRLRDMFQFFRAEGGLGLDHKHPINTGYWSEKLQQPSKCSEFCGEHAKGIIEEWIKEQHEEEKDYGVKIPDIELTDWTVERFPKSAQMQYYLENDLNGSISDIEDVRAFAEQYEYQDWWDHSWETKTYHFVWCCYALVWAIQQYDESKEPNIVADPSYSPCDHEQALGRINRTPKES